MRVSVGRGKDPTCRPRNLVVGRGDVFRGRPVPLASAKRVPETAQGEAHMNDIHCRPDRAVLRLHGDIDQAASVAASTSSASTGAKHPLRHRRWLLRGEATTC